MIAIDLRFALADLYAAYADCLDQGRLEEWPGLFIEDCRYRVMPRENHEHAWPLCTIDLQSRGALKDRIYAARNTLFHAPYYQRHVIGPLRIVGSNQQATTVEANYVVLRTRRDEPSELFNTGRYIDRVVSTPDGLRFADKLCVFDSELVPNSIIYPI